MKKQRKVTYYLHDARMVASGYRYLTDRETQVSYTTNLRFFCPVCGNIWASMETELSLPGWIVETQKCAAHGDGMLLSSRFSGVNKQRFDGAPLALLSYEVERLLSILDK